MGPLPVLVVSYLYHIRRYRSIPGPSLTDDGNAAGCFRDRRRHRHAKKARAARMITPTGAPTPAPTATALTDAPTGATAALVVAEAAEVLAAVALDDDDPLRGAAEVADRAAGALAKRTTPWPVSQSHVVLRGPQQNCVFGGCAFTQGTSEAPLSWTSAGRDA